MSDRTRDSQYALKELPETVEIEDCRYEELSFGSYKKVYRSREGGKVGILSSRGASFEDQAVHIAGILQNERAQRKNGVTTATEYETVKAVANEEVYPALTGNFRGDLITHGELDEMLEDREVQEKAYREIFQPIKKLAEKGKTTASPLDFINIDNRDSSNLIFDTRNFGYNPKKDRFEVIDNGELEPRGYSSTAEVPEADLSEFSYAEPEDFAFQRPHDSVEDFIKANKVDQKAQQIITELS